MLFSGYFRTTDGRKWSVAFHALSWDDARSIASAFGVTVDGTLLKTYDAVTLDEVPSLAHFASWHVDGDRFYDEDMN